MIEDGGNIQEPSYSEINYKWYELDVNIRVSTKGEKIGIKNISLLGVRLGWVTFLILLFVICGTINTIFFKFQNESNAKGFGTGPPVLYAHPFSQAVQMFCGMIMTCLTGHWIKDLIRKSGVVEKITKKNVETEKENQEEKLPPINQLLFLIPATCDLVASSFLYIGLIYTYASVYQMLRASVVVFTSIFAVIFLKQTIWKYPNKWAGVIFIVIGTFMVGYASVTAAASGAAKAKNPWLGGGMVILAQVVYATQFVFEETFLTGYDTDPLQVPGYEGFWGLWEVLIILFVLYWIPGADFGSLENFPASVLQCIYNWPLMIYVIALIINIGFYNFTGNWITKELSAATRTTIDCIRNVLVWIIQLARGYQTFSWLQLAGFVVLVLGTFFYNEVFFSVLAPWYCRWSAKQRKKDAEAAAAKKEEKKKKKENKRIQKIMDKEEGEEESTPILYDTMDNKD